uniref:Armadillo repeat-containing protein 8 n=1 Tax=Zonotrichia albicollis TaxID=44394 RepID=A0A8D2MUN7_ZONAL
MACVLEAPLRMSVLSEVTASSRHYVDRLFDLDPQKVLQGVIDMKNAVIGNNKQKANLIVLGAVPRLLYLLQQETSSTELRTECAVVLGSLAMGTENNVKSLLDCHIIPALLQGLLSPDLKFIEACLRCLRTIFISPVTPEDLLYTDGTVISHLMALLSRSPYTQEYICQIFSHCCKGPDHQTILFNHGAVQNIAHLLVSTSYKVRMQALKCFSVLAFENPQVSMTLVNVSVDGELLPQIFVKMLQRDKPIEMQLTSAKCLILTTLPCLVRMCSKDRLLEERVEGAETLAYLIETDVELQRMASITDHLIVMLADYFKYPSSVSAITDIKRLDHDLKHAHELRQAAFKLYASLGANDEDIRKKPILESGAIELLCSLTQSENLALRVNGIWALMNMAFQAEQKIKSDILRGLSTEQLFQLLSDSDVNVLMKTLGLLRNLLSTRPHIDHIMSTHGKQIMQAVTLILEGEHNIEVKEQTLCILANIADGTTAKELIMTNDDILQKIKYYMSHSNAKLQLAAMFCISNLIWNEEEGKKPSLLMHRQVTILIKKLLLNSNICSAQCIGIQSVMGNIILGVVWIVGVVRRHEEDAESSLGETQGHSDNKQELERHRGGFHL